MVKFTHVFVMLILISWLAVSGCVENSNNVEKTNQTPNVSGTEKSTGNLTETDVQEFEKNVTDLDNLLNNSTTEEDIVVEEIR